MTSSQTSHLNHRGFTFKRFFVAHDESPMRVTTDSVLLGSWVDVSDQPARILDLGCGCGVIGLMVAQRTEGWSCQIDFIDIDEKAHQQCQHNIMAAPFKNRMQAILADINQYTQQSPYRYDLIVSNPPYFASAVECRDTARQRARYTASLDHLQLLSCVRQLLTDHGLFALILPWRLAQTFISLAQEQGLTLIKRTDVNYNPNRFYSLSLLAFSPQAAAVKVDTLCMRHADGHYATAFKQLLADFYLRF